MPSNVIGDVVGEIGGHIILGVVLGLIVLVVNIVYAALALPAGGPFAAVQSEAMTMFGICVGIIDAGSIIILFVSLYVAFTRQR